MTTTRTLDLSNEKSERNEFKPVPQGTYDFEILEASVKLPKNAIKEDGTLAYPYVNVDLKLTGGSLPENGRKQPAGLYLSTVPGKDGKLNYKREAGLLALFESVGASKPTDLTIVPHTAVADDGSELSGEMINAQQVADIVNQSLRGLKGKVYIKVKTEVYGGQSRTRNEIGRFVAPVTEGN